MADSVSFSVATSGSINRHDLCSTCDQPMAYRMAAPGSDVVVASFCANLKYPICKAALVEIPEATDGE